MALKIYIQDVYRATPTSTKYVYRYFSSISAKNIALHGTITQLDSVIDSVLNFELSDPTGSIHVYYNAKKSNHSVDKTQLSALRREFDSLLDAGHACLPVLRSMKDAIVKRQEDGDCDFREGVFVSVVGDVFVDSLRGVRMVSAYECSVTSPERELVWLKELCYLYDEYYIANVPPDSSVDKEKLPETEEGASKRLKLT